MLVSQKITNLRKEKEMSMADLAAAAGITQTSVSRYESGKIKKIEKDKLIRIAKALDVSYDNLIEGDPIYERPTVRGPYSPRKEHVPVQDEYDETLLLLFHNLPVEKKKVVIQLLRIIDC